MLLLEMCSLYQVYFCTDVLGIGAAATGVVASVARSVGAVSGLPVGMFLDRMQTRWGRYRPWVVVFAFPLAATAALAFSVPHVSQTGKFAYAVLMFSLFQILYALQNTAYGALLGTVTGDDDERTRLSSLRIGFVISALLVVQSFMLPMVARIGWTCAAVVVAALALSLLAVSGMAVRERMPVSTMTVAPVALLKRTMTTSSVWWLLLAGFAAAAADALSSGSTTYYFPYHATQRDVTFGVYNAVGIAFGLVSLVTLPSRLVRRFRLARALTVVWIVAGAAFLAFRCLPTDAVWSLMALKAVLSVATASASALFWSTVAKVALDSGAGGIALVTALACFSQKAGGAVGASGFAFTLSGTGFVPHAALSEATREFVRLAMSALPALLLFLSAWSVSRLANERKER